MTIRKGRKIIAGNGAAAIATIQNPGLVQPDGQTISITEDGIITANVPEIDTSNLITKDSIATNDVVGLVKPDGTTITIDEEGRISSNLEIPEVSVATAETTGVVKPDGETITITEDGVISAAGGVGDAIVITEAYVNGTSGYNVYSNGYCEQWGKATTVASAYTVTVTLSKPYKDANYNILGFGITTSADAGGVVNSQEASSFVLKGGNKLNGTIMSVASLYWKTTGYIS